MGVSWDIKIYKGYRFGFLRSNDCQSGYYMGIIWVLYGYYMGIIWVLYGYYMGIQYSGSIWSWWKFNQTILDWTFENLARISSKLMDVELHPGWSCIQGGAASRVELHPGWSCMTTGLRRAFLTKTSGKSREELGHLETRPKPFESCCALIAAATRCLWALWAKGPPKTIL